MALEGSLKEFGLADILQLLYYQRKTGVLSLESKIDRVRLLFHEGKIVFAESKRRSEENRLGKILLKKGVVNEQNLQEAIKEHRSTGSKLGHILLKRNFVEREIILEILQSQITEIVTQLLAWKEGIYEFKPQGVPVDKEIPISIDTQHLLMDGLRIVDEWSLIEGKINLNSMFEKTSKTDAELTAEETEVLALVDGESDVSAIADLSGMDNFLVSKTLLALCEKGVLAPKQAAPAKEAVREEATAKSIRIPALGFILAAAILISLGLSIFSAMTLPMLGLDLKEIKASEAISDLRIKIEAHRYSAGSYPASLKQVGDERDSWGTPYIYSYSETDFGLSSAGPDRTNGTKDDIY